MCNAATPLAIQNCRVNKGTLECQTWSAGFIFLNMTFYAEIKDWMFFAVALHTPSVSQCDLFVKGSGTFYSGDRQVAYIVFIEFDTRAFNEMLPP